MNPFAAILGGAGGLSDIIGNLVGQGQLGQAQNIIQGVNLPTPQAQAYLMGPNAYNNIQVNPAYQNAQLAALASLQGIGNQGGMNAVQRANVQNLMNEVGSQNAGAMQAAAQKAQQQGLYGSGFALANKLNSAQQLANRENQNEMNQAASAQAQALQALQGAGSLGLQASNLNYNQQARRANAQNFINQFNAQNQTGVSEANAGYQQANNAQRLGQAEGAAGYKGQQGRMSAGLGQQLGQGFGYAGMGTQQLANNDAENEAYGQGVQDAFDGGMMFGE